jgi:hypothetical protein
VRAVSNPGVMKETTIQLDVDRLIGEIQRYLAAVDAFRSAGCALRWRREAQRSTPGPLIGPSAGAAP